jgi:excisionase family DNA binding protein
MNSTQTLMDIGDVAKALRVSPHTVRRWATEKKLRRIKLGSRTLFDPADVAEFIDQAKNVAGRSHSSAQAISLADQSPT